MAIVDKETKAVSHREVTLAKDEGNRPETTLASLAALPPVIAMRSGAVKPSATRCSAAAMKSVNVWRLWSSLPPSYHARPISSPPRTWAIATIIPRSSRLRLLDENAGS